MSPPIMPVDNNFFKFSNFGSNDTDIGKFQFACVNQSVVLLCFNLIRSNALGCDNMHPRFIRILLPVLLPYITYIFNCIIIIATTFPLRCKWRKYCQFRRMIPNSDQKLFCAIYRRSWRKFLTHKWRHILMLISC